MVNSELKHCNCYPYLKTGMTIQVDKFNPLICSKCKGVIDYAERSQPKWPIKKSCPSHSLNDNDFTNDGPYCYTCAVFNHYNYAIDACRRAYEEA